MHAQLPLPPVMAPSAALSPLLRLARDEHAGAEQMFADYCSADLWHVVGALLLAVPLSLLFNCELYRFNL